MPPRHTIRLVVGTYRRKAFGTRNTDGTPRRPAYPSDAIVAFYGILELAEEQPRRGCFESERLLRVLLEGPTGTGRRYARQVPFLIEQGDLVRTDDGGVAVDGWDLLQEGDVTIADRVARYRHRKRADPQPSSPANGAANGAANGPRVPKLADETRAGDAHPQGRGDGDGFGDGFGDGCARNAEADDGRADVEAFQRVTGRVPTRRQRAVLDGVLRLHDVTGPRWAAGLILANPGDPIGAVIAADKAWREGGSKKRGHRSARQPHSAVLGPRA